MPTEKQKAVIAYCLSHSNRITKKDAMAIINDHYCNGQKHVGDVLSRMVKAGMLIREKPGVFVLGKGKRNKRTVEDNNQPEMF